MQEHIGKTCPYCQYTIKPDVDITICAGECKMPHHKECWDENCGCTTFGCSESPAISSMSNMPIQPTSSTTVDEAVDQQEFTVNDSSHNQPSSNSDTSWLIAISVAILFTLFIFTALYGEDQDNTDESVQSNKSIESVGENINDTDNNVTIIWDNGIYIGQLKNGNIPHGEGEWSNQKGDEYAGEWKEGKKHGYGTYIWADGREYAGAWLNDYRNGQGHWINPSKGYEYEGGWKNGYFHGEGTFIINTSQGQEIYEGEYRNNEKHGYGEWTFPDGTIYVGQHRDGMKHGEGELIYADGSIISGDWAYGEYVIEQETITSFNNNINTSERNASSQAVQSDMAWGTLYNYSSETFDYYINGFYVVRLNPGEQYELPVPIGHTYFAAYDIYEHYGSYYEMYINDHGWYFWMRD